MSGCLKFSSLLLFMLILQAASAQSRNARNAREYGTDKYASLDALLAARQKALGNDAVALVVTDTIVYKKEMGEFDAKTVAPLASASKWLTTALIMILVDEGKLTLEDKISDYLPVFSTYGKNYITIRHCLSHYTGIESSEKLMGGKKFESLDEEVASFAKKEIQTNPGTEFRYSNMGMSIAGRIAEIVTKKKFDQLIKQRLFNPLTMTKTTFSSLDGSALDPANGARSTALDYMKFLQMLLQKGKFNGKQVLSEGAVAELRKIHATSDLVKFAPRGAAGFHYALGSWVMENVTDTEASTLSNPGLFGTWAMVDWCRGYAYIFLTKDLLAEQKTDHYIQMKGAIDETLQNRCK